LSNSGHPFKINQLQIAFQTVCTRHSSVGFLPNHFGKVSISKNNDFTTMEVFVYINKMKFILMEIDVREYGMDMENHLLQEYSKDLFSVLKPFKYGVF
jgi:hypothetical protein